MRSGAAAGHVGYFHETAFYGGDDELLAVTMPFLRDGVAAGEPTVVAFAEHNATLTRAALGDTTGITFLAGEERYARPAAAIRAYRELFAALVAGGARQIRVIGDVPHPGTGADWAAWRRYEAAVNHAYDDFPLWGICPYDTRITPDDVLEDVARTHPHVATPQGHDANPRFEDPAGFLHAAPQPAADPVEATPPDALLADPPTAAARAVAVTMAARAGLDGARTDDLVLALTELCTNAHRHGRPPVLLRLWARPGRVVATVTDAGDGTADPWAGLVGPSRLDGSDGFGLWLLHQVCREIALRRDPDGFTVQLAIS